jgi:DNA mismatch repair protein MutL
MTNNLKISVLPDHLINQIAAGEVIENPASVVKELLENSLDAKAKNITIETKGGGLGLIRIDDDGIGMKKEDLLLSIKRHATSKITSFDDLLSIKSLGFRGEALASVAAISKMKIISSTDGETATLIEVENGKILKILPYSRNRGTTIEISSLFYNVPARKKFQRGASYNNLQISKTILNIALGREDVSINMLIDEKVKKLKAYASQDSSNLDLSKAFTLRAKDVIGDSITSFMNYVYFEEGPFRLYGLIGVPSIAKKNRSGNYLLVNKRFVQSYMISSTIKDAYGTRLSENSFPVFAINIDIDAKFIDVNVHPQKKEIRISEEMFVKTNIFKAISSCLNAKSHSYSESADNREGISSCDYEPYNNSFSKPISFVEPLEKPLLSGGKNSEYESYSFEDTKENKFETLYQQQILSNETNEKISNEQIDIFQNENKFSQDKFSLFGKYFCDNAKFYESHLKNFEKQEENFNGFIIFDLEKAVFRIVFEKMEKNEKISSQILASPIILELLPKEIELANIYNESFLEMGIEFRQLGNSTISIDAIPSFIKEENFKNVFETILYDFSKFGKNSLKKIDSLKRKKIAQNLAKSSKGKKKIFSDQEAKYILEKLFSCNDCKLDPLGSNIYSILDENALGKFFK